MKKYLIILLVASSLQAMQQTIEQLRTDSQGSVLRVLDIDENARDVIFLHPKSNQLYDAEISKDGPSIMSSSEELLSLAVEDRDSSYVNLLLDRDKSIVNKSYKNRNDRDAQFPLERAVKKRNIETIRLLLEAGADPNQEELLHDCLNSNPLFYALTLGDSGIEIIKLLEKHGVDPEKHTYADLNALQYARLYKMNKALQILEPGDPLD